MPHLLLQHTHSLAAFAAALLALHATAMAPRGRHLLIANANTTGAVSTFGTVAKSGRNPLLKIGARLWAD